jgi:LCP family protein required for cell wall assembly
MPREPEPSSPNYKRYRATPRVLGRRESDALVGDIPTGTPRRPRRPGEPPGAGGTGGRDTLKGAGWRTLKGTSKHAKPKRLLLYLLGLIVAWLALSLVLFLVSAHFERTPPPSDVAAALKPAGFPLTSPNNILVLGSDRRPKGSKEPGANTTGPSRSDTIMLIRTGGGHAARLSIPRDTIVDIPGHGLNKINAAYAFGGPALSIRVVEELVHIPINHLVEVNFENFPQLIDAMGGVDYTGGCIVANLDGGFRNGGFTLRLPKGTHRLDGKQALALARTRENLCKPNETDIQREEHQQALFNDMKSRLASFSSFVRMPLIAWNAPPAIISDMSGTTLLGLFGALAIGGTPPTHVLKPSGNLTLPDGEEGLAVSESERRAAAARFLAG